MNTHLNSFFDLADRLNEINIKLPDELLSIILLSCLPSSFENFVIAIESRGELPKPDMFKNKLMLEFNRRDGGSASGFSVQEGESAFFFKNQRTHKIHKQSTQFRGKYYKCNRKGHYASSCNATRSTGSKESSSFAMLNTAGSVSLTLNKSVWVFDSRSKCHTCCEKKMFAEIKAHREKIQLATNNYMYSDGIGVLVIETSTQIIKLSSR